MSKLQGKLASRFFSWKKIFLKFFQHVVLEEAEEVQCLDQTEVRSSRSRRLHTSAGLQVRIWRLLRWRLCLPCGQAGTEFWLCPAVLIKLQMNFLLWCQWGPEHPEETWAGLEDQSGQSVTYTDHSVYRVTGIRTHTVTDPLGYRITPHTVTHIFVTLSWKSCCVVIQNQWLLFQYWLILIKWFAKNMKVGIKCKRNKKQIKSIIEIN